MRAAFLRQSPDGVPTAERFELLLCYSSSSDLASCKFETPRCDRRVSRLVKRVGALSVGGSLPRLVFSPRGFTMQLPRNSSTGAMSAVHNMVLYATAFESAHVATHSSEANHLDGVFVGSVEPYGIAGGTLRQSGNVVRELSENPWYASVFPVKCGKWGDRKRPSLPSPNSHSVSHLCELSPAGSDREPHGLRSRRLQVRTLSGILGSFD